jgi:hypothetical protein
MTSTVAAGLLMLAILAPRRVDGQKPIRDDDRAYSKVAENRGYVAARCAALYSEMAQATAGQQDSVAAAKASESRDFLKRVPDPPENVFLEWSSEYRARLTKESNPEASLWGKDYEACSGVLHLIRGGDNMAKYSRRELRYLMGGDAERPPK